MSTSWLFKCQAVRFASVLIACAFSIGSGFVFASSTRADILVIAPHPDDDILTSAGVIYRARHASPPVVVWVMYMTNGDWASTGTQWGLQREAEAVLAQALIGVDEDHLMFLGYPDGSLQNLFGPSFRNSAYEPSRDGYQGSPSDIVNLDAQSDVAYAERGLGRVAYSRFRTAVNSTPGPAVPNMGANVLADLAHFLTTRQPTDIFVTSSCDQHADHAATYGFVRDALQAVRASNSGYDPIVHQTLVWAGTGANDDWPLAPSPLTFFTEPVRAAACLSENALLWAQRESLDVPLPLQVTNYDTNLKSRAIEHHVTQGGFTPITVRVPSGPGQPGDGHISAFVHKDEFFYSARASASNRPPVPNAGPDQAVSAGTLVTLNGSGSFDPEGDPLNYQWRQSDGPTTVTLSSTSAQRPTFTVPASATNALFAFELKVSNTTSFANVADAVTVSTGGTPQPVDGGVVPVDSGTPPPIDSGTQVDAGTRIDAGTPPVDSGVRLDASTSADAGANPDAGAQQPDAGAQQPDAGAQLADGGVGDAALDAAILADAAPSPDAMLVDAASSPDVGLGGSTSAWPGDESFEQDVDDIIHGDAGEGMTTKDSGCSLATSQGSSPFSGGFLTFGLAALLLRRRRVAHRDQNGRAKE